MELDIFEHWGTCALQLKKKKKLDNFDPYFTRAINLLSLGMMLALGLL